MSNNWVPYTPRAFEEKKRALVAGGARALHVVADFDSTLTKAFVNAKKLPGAIQLVMEGNYLGPEYAREYKRLFDYYHPFEENQSLSLAERSKKMNEWWSVHIQVLHKYGMNMGIWEDILEKELIPLREGVIDFFKILETHNIPVLVFSAASGDMITRFLTLKKCLTSNVHVLANFYELDAQGRVLGYKNASHIIHTLSKNEGHVKGTPYEKEVLNRPNVLLLGDSLEDIDMVEGLPHKTVLKIGFLNERNNVNLLLYKERYDALISGDGPMDFVNRVLREVLAP
ncbi:MAG: hypothetical protein HY393_02495 [Candidatus Diapherotrites archaeon]|nr:hypothetical protein [Candidatus Diapherotrites archaeon]